MPQDDVVIGLVPDPQFGTELRKMISSSLKDLTASFSTSGISSLQSQLERKLNPKIKVGLDVNSLNQLSRKIEKGIGEVNISINIKSQEALQNFKEKIQNSIGKVAIDIDQSQFRRLETRVKSIAKSFDLVSEAKDKFAKNVDDKFPKIIQHVESLNKALLNTRKYLNSNIQNPDSSNSYSPVSSTPVNHFSNNQGGSLQRQTKEVKELGAAHRDAGKHIVDFSDRVKIASQRLAAYAIPGKIIYELNSFVQLAKTQIVALDKEVNQLTQTLNGNAQAAQNLSGRVLDIGKKYGQSGNDILQITNILAKSKNLFSGEDGISSAVNKIAQTGLSSNFSGLAKTTDGLTAALGTFNLTGNKTGEVLDAISKLSKDFNVSADDLFSGIENGGTAFVAAGGNIKEYLAVLTALKQTTQLSTPQIAQGLNEIFSNLDSPKSTINANILTKGKYSQQKTLLGRLQTVSDATAGFSDQQLKPVIEGLTGTQETRFAAPLLRELQKPNSQVARALNSQNNSAGSAAADAAIGSQSLSAQLGAVTANFDQLFEKISQSKGLKDLVTDINDLSKGLASVLEFASPLIPLLIKLAAIKGVGFGLSLLKKKPSDGEKSTVSVLGVPIGTITKRGGGPSASGSAIINSPNLPILPNFSNATLSTSRSSNSVLKEQLNKAVESKVAQNQLEIKTALAQADIIKPLYSSNGIIVRGRNIVSPQSNIAVPDLGDKAHNLRLALSNRLQNRDLGENLLQGVSPTEDSNRRLSIIQQLVDENRSGSDIGLSDTNTSASLGLSGANGLTINRPLETSVLGFDRTNRAARQRAARQLREARGSGVLPYKFSDNSETNFSNKIPAFGNLPPISRSSLGNLINSSGSLSIVPQGSNPYDLIDEIRQGLPNISGPDKLSAIRNRNTQSLITARQNRLNASFDPIGPPSPFFSNVQSGSSTGSFITSGGSLGIQLGFINQQKLFNDLVSSRSSSSVPLSGLVPRDQDEKNRANRLFGERDSNRSESRLNSLSGISSAFGPQTGSEEITKKLIDKKNAILLKQTEVLKNAGLTDEEISVALKQELESVVRLNTRLKSQVETNVSNDNLRSKIAQTLDVRDRSRLGVSGIGSRGKIEDGLYENASGRRALSEDLSSLSAEYKKKIFQLKGEGATLEQIELVEKEYIDARNEDILSLKQLTAEQKILAAKYSEASLLRENSLVPSAGPKTPSAFNKFLTKNDIGLQLGAFAIAGGLSYGADTFGAIPQGSILDGNGKLKSNFGSILDENKKNSRISNILSSISTGLITGSTVGSLIEPGIGTVVGGVTAGIGAGVNSAIFGNSKLIGDQADVLGNAQGNSLDLSTFKKLDNLTIQKIKDQNKEDNRNSLIKRIGLDAIGLTGTGEALKNNLGFFPNNTDDQALDNFNKTDAGQTRLQGFLKQALSLAAKPNTDGSIKTKQQVVDELKQNLGSESTTSSLKSLGTNFDQAVDPFLANIHKNTDIAQQLGSAMLSLRHGLTEANDKIEQESIRISLSTGEIKARSFSADQSFNIISGKGGSYQLPQDLANRTAQGLQYSLNNSSFNSIGGRQGIENLIYNSVGNNVNDKDRNVLSDDAQIQLFARNSAKTLTAGLTGSDKDIESKPIALAATALSDAFRNIVSKAQEPGGELHGISSDEGKQDLGSILTVGQAKISQAQQSGSTNVNVIDILQKSISEFDVAAIAGRRLTASFGNLQAQLDYASDRFKNVAEIQKDIASSLSQSFSIRLSRAREGTSIGQNPFEISQNIGGLIGSQNFNPNGLLNAAQDLGSAQTEAVNAKVFADQNPKDASLAVAANNAQNKLTQAQTTYDIELGKSTNIVQAFRARLEETTKQLGELQNSQRSLGSGSFGDAINSGVQLKVGQNITGKFQKDANAFGLTNSNGIANLTEEQKKQLEADIAPFAGTSILNNSIGAFKTFGGFANKNGTNGQTLGQEGDLLQVFAGKVLGIRAGVGDGGTQETDLSKLLHDDNTSIIGIEDQQLKSLNQIRDILAANTKVIIGGYNLPQDQKDSLIASLSPKTQDVFSAIRDNPSLSASLNTAFNDLGKVIPTSKKSRETTFGDYEKLAELQTGKNNEGQTIKFDGNFNFTGFENTPQDKVVQMTLVKIMGEFASHLDTSDAAQAQLKDKIDAGIRSVSNGSDKQKGN